MIDAEILIKLELEYNRTNYVPLKNLAWKHPESIASIPVWDGEHKKAV